MRKVDWNARREKWLSSTAAIRNARVDAILDAILDELGTDVLTFDELLTDPDMEMLRGMKIEWRVV